ncbi:hypothetical protein BGZ54_003077 [Gamsiella multidivaricata]|nr:hypothetical protein BGZ54_003077 [Gamsiella multidivaricata]
MTISDIHRNNHARYSRNDRTGFTTNSGYPDNTTDLDTRLPSKYHSLNKQSGKSSFSDSIGFNDDDDDMLPMESGDDFQVSIRIPRRTEDQEGSSEYRRHRSSAGKGDANDTTHSLDSSALKRHRGEPQTDERFISEEAWFSSQESMDLSLGPDTASLDKHSPITRVKKAAPSTHITVSDTQHALNEIDELFQENFAPLSPILEPQSSAEHEDGISQGASPKTPVLKSGLHSEIQSATKDVREASKLSIDEGDDLDDDIHLEDAHSPKMEHTKLPEAPADYEDPMPGYDTGQDQSQSQGQGPNQDKDQSSEAAPVFEVPTTTDEFKSRLNEIRIKFHLSLESMMEAVQGVDSLLGVVKDALMKQQSCLDERGQHVREQVLGLQREATQLHTKAARGLD